MAVKLDPKSIDAAEGRLITGADPVPQSNAHYRLGMIKEKMGVAPAAATEYRAALDLYPRHEPAAAPVTPAIPTGAR